MNGSFCFVYEEISSSIPKLLVTLLAHRRKRSNSCSQMFFKTVFTCSLRPVPYTFPKFYFMIDNSYFRAIFYYCKIGPRNRKNFAIDWSEFLVKRWFFVKQFGFFSSKDFFFFFFYYLIISLSQRFISSSNCKENLLA